MPTTITAIGAAGARETADAASLLGAAGRERARDEANRWVKRLRLVRYHGVSMRERFTYRGDSLWWFTELYLHKMRRLDVAVSTILALDAARARWAPAALVVETTDDVVRQAAEAFGAARGVKVEVAGGIAASGTGRRWSSYLVGLTAKLTRMRPGSTPAASAPAKVAAFVHTAFWREASHEDGPRQEAYIGAILDAVATRLSPDALACVGVGPQRNFRARRWWDPITGAGGRRPLITPIERLASGAALAGALDLWRRRRSLAEEVVEGDDVRAAGAFDGCDLWPILREQLTDAALVQWPWSARAMDEAGAAIDALSPDVVLTYAEAGGWGRAIVLEARRRGVASVGAQHGFIYRHWLNYQHEADEWRQAGETLGFPAPDRTLLFDRYAAEQLTAAGRFPPDTLRVTGSPGLDALADRVQRLRRDARGAVRRELGVAEDQRLLVLAAKFSEIRDELPALFAAVSARPSLRIVVKPHPAETAALYAPAASGRAGVSVAPAGADLARLLAGADAIVTMNSTVAIDGLALGVPALVVGTAGNLTPFVEQGVMTGATGAGIGPAIDALMYDAKARETLTARAREFTARYDMRADGGAAARAADEVLALVTRGQ